MKSKITIAAIAIAVSPVIAACGSSASAKPATTSPTASPSAVNYPTAGAVPAPLNNYVGGHLCDTSLAQLIDGKLTINQVQPVTEWSIQWDDAQGQPIGADAIRSVDVEDSASITATAPGRTVAASVSMSGETNGTCVVVAK